MGGQAWFTAVGLSMLVCHNAHAQVETPASDAIARYRLMTSVAPTRCTTDPDPAVITVCATKLRDSQKVPYIDELRVGDRPKLVLGEVPRAAASADASAPCPMRGCPGSGSVLGAIGKLIERIRD